MRPLTMRADATLLSLTSLAVMIGVEICLDALIISLMRGTPSVTSKRDRGRHPEDPPVSCSAPATMGVGAGRQRTHRGDTGKVERLEGHLRSGLADRLCADGADGGARLDHGLDVLAVHGLEERLQLRGRQAGQVVHQPLAHGCVVA